MVIIARNIPFIGEVFLEYHSSFKWKFYLEWLSPQYLKEEEIRSEQRFRYDLERFRGIPPIKKDYDSKRCCNVHCDSKSRSTWRNFSIRIGGHYGDRIKLDENTSLDSVIGSSLSEGQKRAA